ncbi:MAG: hypothetical protein FWD28_02950 [Treponema sp.]|nr:hypothetical protein [Treponema sp.]
MVNKRYLNKKFIFIICLAFLFSNCVSLAENTGRMLDGSAFAEKIINKYYKDLIELNITENKLEQTSIIFIFNDYPMIKIRGSFSGNDNIQFDFTSLEYLAGNVHGWNEFSLELTGSGSLILQDITAELKITENIEAINITQGRIHRFDTRITGNEALIALQNRRERIQSLCEWKKTINSPAGLNIRDFERYWKPIILPETVSARHRPPDWLRNTDVFTRAEEINWNTGYTERTFTEELRNVRNSGTLLRDWEEALSWIYFEYNWENIIELLKDNKIFTSVR